MTDTIYPLWADCVVPFNPSDSPMGIINPKYKCKQHGIMEEYMSIHIGKGSSAKFCPHCYVDLLEKHCEKLERIDD